MRSDRSTCPWSFEDVDGIHYPRETRGSAALGRWLAKRAEKASTLDLGEMCSTCALRSGSLPNRCIDTIADVVKCAVEHERSFRCHDHRRGGQACTGAIRLRVALFWARGKTIEKLIARVERLLARTVVVHGRICGGQP